MKATDDDGGLYDLMSGSYQLMGSLDGVYDAILANPEIVLRALGGHQPDPTALPDIWCIDGVTS